MTGKKESKETWIDDLINDADVKPDNRSAARGWLSRNLSGVVSRPTPVDWNAPLDDMKKLAEALRDKLRRLRSHPYQHAAFWTKVSEVFGPVEHGGSINPTLPLDISTGSERRVVIRAIQEIIDAAEAARRTGTGRPPARAKQATIDNAARFWLRFSSHGGISGTSTGRFHAFATKFYEASTGIRENVDRQVKEAARRIGQK